MLILSRLLSGSDSDQLLGALLVCFPYRSHLSMFDARHHVDAIRRTHSQAPNILPVFLDMVASFALFRKSAINLLVIGTLLNNTVVPLFILLVHTIIFSFENLSEVGLDT